MDRICERLLNFVQVIDHKGTVRLCGWLYDNIIGSLSCQGMQEIYHSEHANELRKKLAAGDYSSCIVDACPYLAMGDIDNHMIEVDGISAYPEELHLAYEQVCNYHCTSCNIHNVMEKNKNEDLEKGYDLIESRLAEVLPHVKRIGANGHGELFVSRRILNLLANWKPLAPAEEVSVFLETNGSLFDEAHWKQIENLGQYHLSVAITVMSFDEQAYQLLSGTSLPISQIENNLRFVKSLREKGIVNYFEIATVVQERNFRDLPEFTRRCIEEFGADYVRLRPYMPWGAREPEIEWFTDVRNPRHPYYEEYRKAMKNEIFKHPLVHDWSGGLDTVNAGEFPYKASYFKEQILTEIILNMESMAERLKRFTDNGQIVIYGLGNVGKVLIKELCGKGIRPVYILDKYKTCDQFCGIDVYDLKDTVGLEKEVDIIVTPLLEFEKIHRDLKSLGYNGKLIRMKKLLSNEILAEKISEAFG